MRKEWLVESIAGSSPTTGTFKFFFLFFFVVLSCPAAARHKVTAAFEHNRTLQNYGHPRDVTANRKWVYAQFTSALALRSDTAPKLNLLPSRLRKACARVLARFEPFNDVQAP